MRGLGAVLAGAEESSATAPARAAEVEHFPDDEARAFAIRFARAYLTVSSEGEAARQRAVDAFLAEGLSDQATVRVSPRSPGASVAQAMVARVAPLGSSRALLTVAASMRDGRTLYLTVPVWRSASGGLAVYDLPSFSPPPVAAQLASREAVPITRRDVAAISDVTSRFLRAYLSGADAASLAYFLAPGVQVAAMPAGQRVVAVDEIAREAGTRSQLVVGALVRVRDSLSRTIYPLRYRVSLVERDRWYVMAVAGGPGS